MTATVIPGGPRVPAELVTDAGVNVEQDAVLIVPATRAIDFEGAGVTVANDGGVAVVTISGGAGGTVQTNSTLTGDGSGGDLLGINPGHVSVVADGTTIAGDGQTGTPLHTVDGGTGVVVDGTTIGGTGKTGSPLHTIGGGGSGVNVEQGGTPIVSGATTLDFTGATVTDEGGGVASIAITGGGVNVLNFDSTVVSAASGIRFLGTPVTVTVDGGDPTIADVTVTVPGTANFQIDATAGGSDGWNPGQCVWINPALHRVSGSINNDTEQDAQVVGIITQNQVGTTVHVCVGGPLTLTAPQWSGVIAEGGNLVEGIYYLADSSAGTGFITAIKPASSGSFITVVGYAVSTTTLVVRPEAAVLIP